MSYQPQWQPDRDWGSGDDRQAKLKELAARLEAIVEEVERLSDARNRAISLSEEEIELQRVAAKAIGIFLLLPPRPPTAALECPHCGKPISVGVGK